MKVGDYVRTKKGIAKIIGRVSDPTNYYYKFWICDRYLELNYDTEYIHEQDIIGEPKERLIDLIEAGDYVNGFKVSFVDEEPVLGKFVQCDYPVQYGSTNHYRFYEKDIKSIVTKEQFSSMEYKVGE